MTEIKIQIFGQLTVRDKDDRELRISGKKLQGLLAYLAVNSERRVTRDELLGLLWGDWFEAQARQSLRECLSRLRRELGRPAEHCLGADRDHVWLDTALIDIDLRQFHQGLNNPTATELVAVLALYQGPALDGLEIREAGFETWVAEERARQHAAACDLCIRLANLQLANGEAAAAILSARRLLQLDASQEAGHQLLMRAQHLSGDQAGALKQYQICRDILLAEFGVEPGPETEQLHHDLSQPGTQATAPGAKDEPTIDPGHKPRITVRPFENLSDDPEQAFFASGITADITTALIKNRWLSVIAHHSSSVFQGIANRQEDVPAELDADYLVEGNVRKAGSRVRISAQLLDAKSGEHIWAERYDRQLEDIFELQDEITQTISGRLEPEVGAIERQRVMHKPTGNLDAWGLFHVGLAHFFKFTAEENARAQELFHQCLSLDPNFAEAHGWLANAKVLSMTYFDTTPEPAVMDEALAAAKRAVEIDDQNAASQFFLGRVYLARQEHRQAMAALETAVSLNPSLALAYCGLGDSLAYEGQMDAAISQFETAIRLSPRDPQLWAFYSYGALAHLFARRFEQTVAWTENAIRIPNCQYWAYAHRVVALGHMALEETASDKYAPERDAGLAALLAQQPGFSIHFADEKLFYIKRPEQRKLYLDGLRLAGVPD